MVHVSCRIRNNFFKVKLQYILQNATSVSICDKSITSSQTYSRLNHFHSLLSQLYHSVVHVDVVLVVQHHHQVADADKCSRSTDAVADKDLLKIINCFSCRLCSNPQLYSVVVVSIKP